MKKKAKNTTIANTNGKRRKNYDKSKRRDRHLHEKPTTKQGKHHINPTIEKNLQQTDKNPHITDALLNSAKKADTTQSIQTDSLDLDIPVPRDGLALDSLISSENSQLLEISVQNILDFFNTK